MDRSGPHAGPILLSPTNLDTKAESLKSASLFQMEWKALQME